MRSLKLAAAAALTLAAAGCAGPTITHSTTSATVAASIPAHCRSANLVLGPGVGVSPMTGEDGIIYKVTNRGHVACTVEGYPRVVLYDSHGAAMPFHYLNGTGQYVTHKKPAPVLLAPNASGYILVAKYRCDIGIADGAVTIQLSLPAAGGVRFTGSEAVNNPDTGNAPPTRGFAYCRGGSHDPGQTVYLSPIEPTQVAAGPF